jgi:hypothetical protein
MVYTAWYQVIQGVASNKTRHRPPPVLQSTQERMTQIGDRGAPPWPRPLGQRQSGHQEQRYAGKNNVSFHIDADTLGMRLKRRWSVARALTTPPKKHS